MIATPVIAVFDVGKTNKKIFLFDEDYKIVYEQSHRFSEITDEDGDACDDLDALTRWLLDTFNELNRQEQFDIKSFNFSSFGASFVHLDKEGKPFLPLYSYLKPYPADLKKKFFDANGGEKAFSKITASPVLDSLNSGLQLYRLKYEKNLLEKGGYSLHLPQYLSSLITGEYYSDITSIGCHTMLWDYQKNNYHEWVARENIGKRLAPIFPSDNVMKKSINGKEMVIGVGLHDSSSALIPYLSAFHQPFVLISTGTWSISLNPFNDAPLTDSELEQDCLRFLTFERRTVKASRLFAGHDHEEAVKKLAAQYDKPLNYFEGVEYDHDIEGKPDSYEKAYHQLIARIIKQQVRSTNLVMQGTDVKRIFVDGGFGKNPVYMNMLASAYPDVEVFAASVSQATAIGAALAVHKHWNTKSLPADIIDLKYYNRSK